VSGHRASGRRRDRGQAGRQAARRLRRRHQRRGSRIARAARDARREAAALHAPATFVYLDRIPLTPNGKVDRNALPKPEWKPLASSTSETARTPVERAVEAIWLDALPGSKANRINESLAAAGGSERELEAILERVRARYGVTLGEALDLRVTVASLVNQVRKELDRIRIA
jgi:hypothetical protein